MNLSYDNEENETYAPRPTPAIGLNHSEFIMYHDTTESPMNDAIASIFPIQGHRAQ